MTGQERELGQIQQKLEDSSRVMDDLKNNIVKVFDRMEKSSKETIEEMAKIKGELSTEKGIKKVEVASTKARIDKIEKKAEDAEEKAEKNEKSISGLDTKIDTAVNTIKWVGGILIGVATIISIFVPIIIKALSG